MTNCKPIFVLLGLFSLGGCHALDSTDYTGGGRSGAYTPPIKEPFVPPDAGADASVELCLPTFVADCSSDTVVDECSSPAMDGMGSVSGVVTLAPGAVPGGGNDATGLLVFAVIDEFNPTACPGDEDVPFPVATLFLHCADLRDGAEVPFTIQGVPVRDKPWQIVPFFDVNPSADEPLGNVDTCDIVSFPVAATVDKPEETVLGSPVALNFGAAVLETMCGLPACE